MSNTYNKQTRMWEIEGTGTLWTNTLGGVPSNTIGPKYITRVVFVPSSASDDMVIQETSSSEDAIKLKAGASDASPVTIDFSAENNGKGRRLVGAKVTTFDGTGTSTAEIYIA